ncbi:MAG TPA: DegV family protein, partial [Clostridia bacterium]|nr:DegV family protein [Clostridia bacterium]
MRKIRILTDSASDIPLKIAERLDIKVLPIPITHDGKSYHERVEFSNEQFYQLLLESRVVPFTSHINANTYLEEYKKAYEQGYTQILNVTINSLGSSMFDSANLAKRMFYEETGVAEDRMRIEVMDSKTYTIAYGLAVIRAAEMADRGIELDDIVAYLSDWFDRLEIMFSVYSLDFVKKSGRVGCAAAFVGELLGLRPVIVFVDGVA